MADSQTALKLIRRGGSIIAWHDYDTPSWPGVTKALNELISGNPVFSGLRRIEGTSVCYAVF